jgi:hypothetical protein
MDYSRHNLRTKHQHKTIPSHLCFAKFKVSTIKLWTVEEWNNLKQITIFLQSSQLEKYFKILKNKTYLTFFFCGTLKSLNIWYFWILTKALMIVPSFYLVLRAYVEFR